SERFDASCPSSMAVCINSAMGDAPNQLRLEDVDLMFDHEESRATVEVPSTRSKLIAEAVAFARTASQLPGVVRIALIGSLTTCKPDPKDADLLVTVTDDADLAPLATVGRKLKGRAQSLNRGADIFLADPRGN
ncbi:MAG: hypothetical protein M1358_10940, partial [Chloroflexi bacterium]|nr:hypothetical protein [Chloroflexota bacterium]